MPNIKYKYYELYELKSTSFISLRDVTTTEVVPFLKEELLKITFVNKTFWRAYIRIIKKVS